MQHKKKLLGGLSLALAAVLAIGGSLAYFTDREVTTAKGVAGSLDITVSNDIDLSQDRSISSNILNPGDRKDLRWTVSEEGNKSADIRTTLTLTSDTAMTDENGQMEFEIYNPADVEEKTDADGNSLGWGPITKPDGKLAQPLQARSVSTVDGKTTITYTPDEYSLNGQTMSGVDAEEDIKDVGSSFEPYYVLIFRQDSTNKFQASKVTLNVLLEAKQHRNTQGKWDTLSNDTYTINGKDVNVVPKNGTEQKESKLYNFQVTNFASYNTLTFTKTDGSKTFTTNQAFRPMNGTEYEDGDGVLGYYDWGGAYIEPGTYTASYPMYDDFGRSLNKTAHVTVNIEDGIEYYDLTDQTRISSNTFTDDDKNTEKMINVTVNVKENPEGKVQIAQSKESNGGDRISPKNDASITSRTFRVLGKNVWDAEQIGIVTETDNFPYMYNGTDNWQYVNYENGDITVNFTGTFTKIPPTTITASTSRVSNYATLNLGYIDTDGQTEFKNVWFNSDNDDETKSIASLIARYGTYKLIDEENKKMYVFTTDADHTSIDLDAITPIDTTITLNNVDKIASATDVRLYIKKDNQIQYSWSLDELKENNKYLMMQLSEFYDESAKKLKDGYTGEIHYTASDGTVTKKTVDLANRTIDFAQ